MIQVGEVLDKYELLERVGQGGMAIVYRGLDRTLKRVVAVKILHSHLADYQEARDRFEREAQAVAKLRHENILEIFDFAARTVEGTDACYIVTEFIDGRTLKQVVTDRPIAFPEIGAMIILQVARALAHAHAQKILHRDIKPENIMIRSDGVVKLMDFGISHMVDLERLTVTGQLLGSPAYMAPEHVEGRPLDFRTDVFAVGIVLYQLTTGKLPFEGKNPHEVLKRIAECKFVDPRQINARIGNRLGRIILRAMAARPDDRYPAITEMVTALEEYLEESGLPTDKIAAELARYFASATSYEQALEVRLVDHLTRRGTALLADDTQRSAALDVFDRVLTIEPANTKVLGILDGLARKQRVRKIALGALAVVAIGGGAFAVHARMSGAPAEGDLPPDGGAVAIVVPASDAVATSSPLDAADEVGSGSTSALVPDAAPSPKRDAGPLIVVAPPTAHDARPAPQLDAPASVGIATLLKVTPRGKATYRIAGGAPVEFDTQTSVVLDGPTQITVSEGECCEEVAKQVAPGPDAEFDLAYRSGYVTPTCSVPGVIVSIDGVPSELGPNPIRFGAVTYEHRKHKIEFVAGPTTPSTFKPKTIDVDIHAGQQFGKVPCE